MNSENNAGKAKDLAALEQIEWLETNGIGGWAGATVAGSNTRRYHGVLVAASKPPVGRMVLLSKLEESVVTAGSRYELGCNRFGDVVAPKGFQYLRSFRRGIFPVFEYQTNGIVLRKTVAAIHGENTTVIIYEVVTANTEFSLELKPMAAARDYHSTTHANGQINQSAAFSNSILTLTPYAGVPAFHIAAPQADYEAGGTWYNNFFLPEEQARGLDSNEDLFVYGTIRRKLRAGDRFGVIVSTVNPAGRDAYALLQEEETRRRNLIPRDIRSNEVLRSLYLAADQFIVRGQNNESTIIAGYHWFTDWGRDTMIALPGICLVTGRYAEARSILRAFARAASQGMLPNRFPDDGGEPEYNTVDATLWFFIAAYKYLEYTGDLDFISREIYPLLKDIIAWHERGTRYGIKVDQDGLLNAGEPGTQLTWMDAKVGDWVVTPRHGKAVEINALWYNALSITADFAEKLNRLAESAQYRLTAKKVKASFLPAFWDETRGALYDCVNGDQADRSIRPNQLLALSLPFELLSGAQAESVLNEVDQQLFTPVGLRSLSPADPQYRPQYGGDQLSRDGGYHQGTVWTWLIGPYITAVKRYRRTDTKKRFESILLGIKRHLSEGCVGSFSEILDGDAPHRPKGCIAQAWSVGEILRAYSEEILENRGKNDQGEPLPTPHYELEALAG